MRGHVLKYKIGFEEAKEWVVENHADEIKQMKANMMDEIHDNINLFS